MNANVILYKCPILFHDIKNKLPNNKLLINKEFSNTLQFIKQNIIITISDKSNVTVYMYRQKYE